eukprot:8923905-Alexandrium_andersonii.AAC.1
MLLRVPPQHALSPGFHFSARFLTACAFRRTAALESVHSCRLTSPLASQLLRPQHLARDLLIGARAADAVPDL